MSFHKEKLKELREFLKKSISLALQIQYCSEIGQTRNAGKRHVISIFSGFPLLTFKFLSSLFFFFGSLTSVSLLSRCELVFENCFVPEENILGKEGKGFDCNNFIVLL